MAASLSAIYDCDDFGRLIEVLCDDAGNRLPQVITVPAPEAGLQIAVADSPDPVVIHVPLFFPIPLSVAAG